MHFYVAVDHPRFKMVTLVELLDLVSRKLPGLPIAIVCSSRDSLDDVILALSKLASLNVSFLHSDLGEAERRAIMQKFQQAASAWRHASLPDATPTAVATAAVSDMSAAVSNAESASNDGRSQPVAEVLAMTDVCLPLGQSAGEMPLSARLLISFDLPSKKDAYFRRLSSCIHPSATAALQRASSAATAAWSASGVVFTSPPPSHETASVSSASSASAAPRSQKPVGLSLLFVTTSEAVKLHGLEDSVSLEFQEMPIDLCEELRVR